MEEYLCWYAHGEPIVPHETIVEMMVGSTFSANNVHGVETDNNNTYKTTVIDAMRMNQDHVSQCRIVDKEPNINVARFFYLLKDSDEPL